MKFDNHDKTRVQILESFAQLFGGSRKVSVAAAPGRVNLVGDHTDYNDGFVFPMAIDRYVVVAAALRSDDIIRAHSSRLGETREALIGELSPLRAGGWERYVEGVMWSLRESGYAVGGVDILIDGNLPAGAGLSSSAALELAVLHAVLAASEEHCSAESAAIIARSAENNYVGVPCGIMDQFAVAMAREGHALLLDCRSLEATQVQMPPDASIVIMDTGRARSLARSEYAARVADCRAAVAAIALRFPGVQSLRVVTADMLALSDGLMAAVTLRRAQHVIAESARPAKLAAAFRDRDLQTAGALLTESHTSLRELYSVSCSELDWAVECALSHRDCYGARMSGAGFGGSAIALVASGHEDDFIATTSKQFAAKFPDTGQFFSSRAVGGVALLN